MTGSLRVTTGPEMAADHERRLRELERRLKASQSDIARGRRTEPAAAGGPSVALFINNNSPWLSSGYHHYDFADSSEADPAWFEWPAGGSDHTRVRLLEPGIYSILATSNGTGGSTHRMLIECGIFGSLGGDYDGAGGSTVVSASGGVAVYPSAIDPSGTDVDVRVYAVGPTNAQGTLSITRWASPYYEAFSGNGFVWEEVTY